MNAKNFFQSKVFFLIPLFFFIVTLFSGFLLVRFLGNVGERYLREQSEDILEAMTSGIQNEFKSAQSAAGAMAGSPWVLPVFLNPNSENTPNANSVLDRYNTNLNFSVCYLLDLQGNAIASSNRNSPDSFVGKNYAFRPYVVEALHGRPSFFMAAGVTSQERGFYAAHPVKDDEGKIVGVAAIKKNVAEVKDVLAGYPNSFFINPDGIVFISGSREMVLRTLWPLGSEQVRAIKDSKQFGLVSFDPILPKPVHDGMRGQFRGHAYQAFRRPLGPPGWSLVLLAPRNEVSHFQFLGWIITAFMSAIILILTLLSFLRTKDQELLRESEEKYRSLFLNSRDAMMILDPSSGRFVSGNPATIAMFGIRKEDEFQSLGPWDLSPERQPDGSLSAVRAKEMIGMAMQKGFHFFEWTHKRAQGENFPATVLLTRMIMGGEIVLQATVRDIAQEKQAKEDLKKKIEELERFNKIAVGRELKMIELKEKIRVLEEGKT